MDIKKIHNPVDWENEMASVICLPSPEVYAADYDRFLSLYSEIIPHIINDQSLVLIANEKQKGEEIKASVPGNDRISVFEAPVEFYYTRDICPRLFYEDDEPTLYDTKFNTYGKFEGNWKRQNELGAYIWGHGLFDETVKYRNYKYIAVESSTYICNGCRTVIAIEKDLFNERKNIHLLEAQLRIFSEQYLGTKNINYINVESGIGEYSNGHIDSLARFVGWDTVIYSYTADNKHPRFDSLFVLKNNLEQIKDKDGNLFNLIELPVPIKRFYHNNIELYPNYTTFLRLNNTVLVPMFGVPEDQEALDIFKRIFNNYLVLGINSVFLLQKNTSLRSIVTKYPKETLNIR